ncbi:MAG: T9SS type A sorting domain-containing protein, partial [Bacteroidia bacterium]
LYYRFNGATANPIPNEALTPPPGATTATIVGGQTLGPTGQCGSALIGNGLNSSTNYVNTGWATNLNGTSWTLSFWTSNVPSTTSTYYILGDVNASSFRVFTGGVAGPGNWILRGGFTDIIATGGASTGPTITTFVYDMPNNQLLAYVNGILVSTVAQTTIAINGAGPFKVGAYSSNSGLPATSLMDEFRLYNRALSLAEIQSLQIANTSSTISPVSCTSVYTAPSGATYTTAGTYMDVIPNVNGCDSTITINLSFIAPVTSTLNTTACNMYTAPSGAQYSVSGTYNDTIPTVGGCDSVITINVIVNSGSTSAIAQTACGMYTAPSGAMFMATGTYSDTIQNVLGCDSVITINLTIVQPTSSTISASVCDMYTAPSGTMFMASGTYMDTIPNMAGCDSVITINLVVTQSTTSAMNVSACTSFTAPSGAMFTASGIYRDTITNMNGCDSVITINLSINQSYNTMSVIACDYYVAPSGATFIASGTYMDTIPNVIGCDSVMTIQLVINQSSISSITATACVAYVAPSGAVFITSGTFMDVIPNATGCDSTITLNITINNVNAAVTQSNAVLTATMPGASYQWLDCTANTILNGATSQSYTATANGNYAVIVTNNGCTDTSNCINVTGIGITENAFGGKMNVYPNPSNGEFFIDLGDVYPDATIHISDVTGRLVHSQSASGNKVVAVGLNAPAGVYFVSVTAGNNKAVIKLVKE